MIKQKYLKYLILPGFALVFMMSLFAGDAFAYTGVGTRGSGLGASSGSGGITLPTGTGLPDDSINNMLTKVLKWFLGFLAALAILMIVVSGIMYITSGGDDSRVETAKNILTYAIIGLVVALLSYVIVAAISGVL